ncbi:nephrocystin-3-like [Xenia sp. Carnegie-2017]|uniref:nephrocystin-3-like n=1 Tax=Xenia sp. Carnegie-2017 TaxID=2897299 RepID=UPI001F04E4A5|nr:nephrocystin-3-like [Xenia sp. Carnegie-2017]
MLLLWEKEKGKDATRKKLADALISIGRSDLSEKVLREEKESKNNDIQRQATEIKSDDPADAKSPSNLPVHTENKEEINQILLEIVEEIPNKWKNLAIFLNIKDAKIKEIELNHRKVVWQGFEMLKFWFESRENKQLWYKELAAALRKIEKNNLAEGVLHKGTTLNKLGDVHHRTKEFDKAKEFHEKALEIQQKSLALEHVDVAMTLNILGNVYYDTNKYAKAKECYKKALKFRQKLQGPEHVDGATILNNLGNVYYETNKYAKAKECYEKALEVRQKSLGSEHVDVATTLSILGNMYYRTNKYAKAKNCYEKALKIRQKSLGPEHVDVATTLNNLGNVYHSTKEYDKAKEFYEKAQAIRKKSAASDHVVVTESSNCIEINSDDTADAKSPSNLPFHTEKVEEINQILLELAQEIPDKWKNLAIFLNVRDVKIKEFDINNYKVVWKGFEMLKFWFESRENKQLWYEELADAFRKIKKNNLAKDVVHKGANVAKYC